MVLESSSGFQPTTSVTSTSPSGLTVGIDDGQLTELAVRQQGRPLRACGRQLMNRRRRGGHDARRSGDQERYRVDRWPFGARLLLEESRQVAIGKEASQLPIIIKQHDRAGSTAGLATRNQHLASRLVLANIRDAALSRAAACSRRRGSACLPERTAGVVAGEVLRLEALELAEHQTRCASPMASIAVVLVLGAKPSEHASSSWPSSDDRGRRAANGALGRWR